MGRANLIELATITFAKQADATAFFKEMLNRYAPRERVGNDDALHLFALIERHPEFKKKVGCGVSHFEVMMTLHGTQCFRIVRQDGTTTDFSYPSCVKGRAPSRKQEVSAAFRHIVRFDLYEERKAFLKQHKGEDGFVECAVTRERILPDDGHIDHRPPMTFEVIVRTFLIGRGLGLDDVPLTSGRDEQTAPEVTDDALAEAFRSYHAQTATLDFVKKSANLAQSVRHRVKQTRMTLRPRP